MGCEAGNKGRFTPTENETAHSGVLAQGGQIEGTNLRDEIKIILASF